VIKTIVEQHQASDVSCSPCCETSKRRIDACPTTRLPSSRSRVAAAFEDAAGTPFTRLTPDRAREIVAGIRVGRAVKALLGPPGDGRNASPHIQAEVQNHIRRRGPVFFSPHTPGETLARMLELSSLDVIEMVKRSGLRGRGGAGFPTGQKWASCRSTDEVVRSSP
jgi:hypothetical protein